MTQIRIVTKTHENDTQGVSKKKKKPHKGYAFIVYEREKDMKGIFTPFHYPLTRRRRSRSLPSTQHMREHN